MKALFAVVGMSWGRSSLSHPSPAASLGLPSAAVNARCTFHISHHIHHLTSNKDSIQPLLPLVGPLVAIARPTVALPLAIPTPRPLDPLVLNMGAFLQHQPVSKCRTPNPPWEQSPTFRPAYLSMSGTMNNRTCDPRM